MFIKKTSEAKQYPPEKYYPVIKSSICNGEKVAGFVEKSTGHFVDIMLVRQASDLDKFKKIYNIEEIKTEY